MHTKNTNGPLARAESKANSQRQSNGSNADSESQPIPINHAAERSVLGAMIEDDSLLPEVIAAGLRVDDFSLSDHRRICSAIFALSERNSPVDYVTVAEELGNRQQDYVLVSSLIEGVVIHEDHILHHVAIVRAKAQLRALIGIGEWLTRGATDSADPEAIIAEAIAKLEMTSAPEVRA